MMEDTYKPENYEILIVEDSPIQATMLRRVLAQRGYRVAIAKHGQDALDKINAQTIHLVISDVEMPVMNGYELCSTIKKDSGLQTIPVILLTTLTDPKDLMMGLNAGADSYLTKPYDEGVLFSRLETLLGPVHISPDDEALEVLFAGEPYTITANRQRILNLLLSTYENAMQQNLALRKAQDELTKLNQQLEVSHKETERLLLNIFPKTVAEELIAYGSSTPAKFDDVSVMFSDFVGFTQVAEKLTAQDLLTELEVYFEYFDSVIEQHHLEKLKTIGDSYMVAGGLPEPTSTHAVDCVLAALEIQRFVSARAAEREAKGQPFWQMRLGIHTGPAVAGVIGKKKFAYDIWGDTVNLASRMESSGEAGKVNVSEDTYQRIKDLFVCEPRGKVSVKHKGEVEMFFVEKIQPEYSERGEGLVPNAAFQKMYEENQSIEPSTQ